MNTCSLIFHIFFIVNFNAVFPCISRNVEDKSKNNKNFEEFHTFQTTLEYVTKKSEENEPNIISDFQTYLANKYESLIKIEELQFLWEKLKEFSLLNGFLTNSRKFRRSKKNFRILSPNTSNMKTLAIEKIESYLQNEDKKFKLARASSNSRSISTQVAERNRKIYLAFAAGKIFSQQACLHRTETFCVFKYFQEMKMDFVQLVPKAFLIKRCPKDCTCSQSHEECLPRSLKNRTEHIIAVFNGETNFVEETLTLNLVDHENCACRNRCRNRKCISNFELDYKSPVECSCKCKDNPKLCQKILKGYHNFTETDHHCILSGECLVPECLSGQLSEENLYLRKCPQVPY